MKEVIKNVMEEIKIVTEKIDNFDWNTERPDIVYIINLIRRGTYLSKKLEQLNIKITKD